MSLTTVSLLRISGRSLSPLLAEPLSSLIHSPVLQLPERAPPSLLLSLSLASSFASNLFSPQPRSTSHCAQSPSASHVPDHTAHCASGSV